MCGAVLAVMVSLLASPSWAQECPINSPLPLYSPETLRVRFEEGGTIGNRLIWPNLSPVLGGCANMLIEDDVRDRLGIRLDGDYLDVFDRRISVQFTNEGVVGSKTLSDVNVTVVNGHPNPAAQNLVVTLNLSSRGGAFRWNPDTGRAIQINEGMPTYLASTSVRSLASSADGSRVYAGVTQVPLLRSDNGGPWVETTIGAPPFTVEPERIVVSPTNPDLLWVRTNREGIWRSEDAGATWRLEVGISREQDIDYGFFDLVEVIPPGGSTPQAIIFAYAAGLGLFYSSDEGSSWQEATGLVIPAPIDGVDGFDSDILIPADLADVRVYDIEPSIVDPGRIYVALQDWGVYEVDVQGGFENWTPRNSTLVLKRNEEPLFAPFGRERTVTDVVVLDPVMFTPDGGGDPEMRDQLVALSDYPPVKVEITPGAPAPPVTLAFTSNDGGESWDERPTNYPLTDPLRADRPVRVSTAFPHPTQPRTVVAALRATGLWTLEVPTDGSVASWQPVTYQGDDQLHNPSVRSVIEVPGGEVILGTINAGTYRIGEVIDIDQAVFISTPSDQVPVATGLTLAFDNPGTIEVRQLDENGDVLDPGDNFEIVAQAYQGYAVWRSGQRDLGTGEPQWELIGLLDLSNPEFCSFTPCDEVALEPIPGCFADKRVNCFGFDLGTQEWTFFDRDVGTGFTYDYAVSTFDYGFTGDETPDGSRRDMLFSPRSPQESSEQVPAEFLTLRNGENYNQVLFQVNTEPSRDLDEVWAVPNPFVVRAGWDDSTNNFIRFFNVTDTAEVQIYTIAGDFVRKLDNVIFNDRETGLIEWDTRNAEGEQVASGVYIYRVSDANGGEEFGRITLIR